MKGFGLYLTKRGRNNITSPCFLFLRVFHLFFSFFPSHLISLSGLYVLEIGMVCACDYCYHFYIVIF